MKIIKVEDCRRCPRPTKYNMSMKSVCQFKHIELDNFPVIPDWCPLEDEQDLNTALNILQDKLRRFSYIDFEVLHDDETWGLYEFEGDEIVSGDTLKELLVNLVKKEGK